MTRRIVPCSACAATWTDERARFCGRCGTPLDPSRDLPPGAARSRSARRRTAVLAGAVTGALVLGAAAVTDVLPLSRRGDPEVALPTADALPTGSRLEPDETAALRAQVDPGRLRCEPRGCELWRRSWAREPALMGLGDLVLLFEDGRLIALDGYTGEERWVEPLDDLQPARGAASAVGPGTGHFLARLDDAIVMGVSGHAVLVDADGTRRWATPMPAWPGEHTWGQEVGDGRLLLMGEGFGSQLMSLLDVEDGSIVWQRETTNDSTSLQDDHALLTGPDGVEIVDLTDGRLVWSDPPASHDVDTDVDTDADTGVTRDDGYDGDAAIHGTTVMIAKSGAVTAFDFVAGRELWTHAYDTTAWPVLAETWAAIPQPDSSDVVLVASDSGRELASFDNATVTDWVEADGRWVILLVPRDIRPDRDDDMHQQGTRLAAIESDGRVVWEHPVDAARRCCTWIRPHGSVVAVMTDDDRGGMREALRVEHATGTLLEVREDAAFEGPRGGWQTDDGTQVTLEGDAVLLRKDDLSVRVFTREPWPYMEAPWVFGSGRDIIGVQLMPDG